MSGDANELSAREQRVNEAIAAYLEAVDAGRTPDPKEFIAANRDIAQELESFLANRDDFERMAKPLLPAVAVAPRAQPDDATLPPTVQPTEAPTIGPTGTVGAAMGPMARSFGDYELLEEIARGGMGVVYKARQKSLNRIVALKMILAGQLASAEDVKRFRSEAEAAAHLDHPGIVPIFEVGEEQGQHYFAMGYVEGQSLAGRLRDGPITSREATELLKQICEAVQYAHEHDVIHRDLKPANVLLSVVNSPSSVAGSSAARTTDHGPRTTDVVPKITDFGLAKRLKEDTHLTGTGQIVGTPSYMSPEQAAGAGDRVGPACDVYSLGAILYQLLTGRPPFQAETSLDTLLQVLDSDPVPPRLLNRNVPRDLEAICLKCLEKDPARRYPSARALRDELVRYQEGDAIQASSVNVLDRVTRALRQSRHEEHFRGWGLGLMAFALVIFLAHVAMFVLEHTSDNPWVAWWLPRSAMFAVLLVLLWRFRPQSMLPTNSAERLVWVVWIGYLLALGAVNIVLYVLGGDARELYVHASILSGFGFLIMGGHVWGGGYVVGLVFLLSAPVLAVHLESASLAFGGLWSAALLTFGVHYWRVGAETGRQLS